MTATASVGLLADRPDATPALVALLEGAWPDWYGAEGPGDAKADLEAATQHEDLPLALVAWHQGQPVGLCVLRAQSLEARPEWGPWATAGLVAEAHRGQGLGRALLRQAVAEAGRLGHSVTYCATNSAKALLEGEGWQLVGEEASHGAQLKVYRQDTGA